MPRGKRAAFPLAFLCLLLGGCGHFGPAADRTPPPPAPMVLSVASDGVY